MAYKVDYMDRIAELRIDNDYTQQTIANELHIAQTTYSDYETGKCRIPIDYLIHLAKFYDVDMNYLCGISKLKRSFPQK